MLVIIPETEARAATAKRRHKRRKIKGQKDVVKGDPAERGVILRSDLRWHWRAASSLVLINLGYWCSVATIPDLPDMVHYHLYHVEIHSNFSLLVWLVNSRVYQFLFGKL